MVGKDMSDGNVDELVYRHYSKVSPYLLIPTASMFILGILAIIGGIWNFNDHLHIDQYSYNLVRVSCAILALSFAVISMKLRMITESIHIMLMSVSTMILSISEFSFGESGFSWANMFFMIGFVTCAFIYARRNQRLMAIATVLMSFSLLVNFLGLDDRMYSVGMLAAGAIYFIIGSKITLLNAGDRDVLIHMGQKDRYSDREYAHVLVSTVGVLSFSILSLVLGYYVIGTEHGYSLYLTKVLLSVIVLMFGTYALRKGVVAEGLMMLLMSLSSFMFAVLHIFGIEGPVMMDLIISIFFLPLAYRFLREHDYLMCVTSVLIFLLMFLESFTEMASMLEVAIMAIKIVSAVMAITAWVYYETGTELLPFLLDHKKHDEEYARELESESPDRNITITSFLVVSLLILWCGLTYINMALVFTETDLITYTCTKIVICVFALIFTVDTFKRKLITEGMMNLIITVSGLSFSICYLMYGVSGPTSLDIIYSLGLYVAAYILFRRKNYVLALASVVFGVSMSYAFFYQVDTSLPMGIGFVFVGVVLAGYAMKSLIDPQKGTGLRIRPNRDESVMLTVAGLFILGVTSLMLTISTDYITYVFAEAFLTVMVSAFAVYALVKDNIAEGLMMLMFAIPTMTYALTVMCGATPSVMVEVIFSILGVILTPLFLKKHNYLLAISVFSYAVLDTVGVVAGLDVLNMLSMLIYSVPVLLYSVWVWINREDTGEHADGDVTPA